MKLWPWLVVAAGAVLLMARRASTLPSNVQQPPGSPPTPGGGGNGGVDTRPVFERGIASYYGEPYNGRLTASGEVFDMNKMTAAHKKLKFGTVVDVTDTATGRTVRVRITDRGPFVAGRVLDLSQGAAEALGTRTKGLADVELRLV